MSLYRLLLWLLAENRRLKKDNRRLRRLLCLSQEYPGQI
jgi:hypothetical protein